ncbi:MAG: haloalkane dehalogenase [Actinomycetota bacterium]|jgi:haloalkane dehalogenase|nr:haloalkane dehalogenase [Actinomycetota bacterium]
MRVLRTPDERFEGLPRFPFAPHYAEVADGEGGALRMHYLDEGPGGPPAPGAPPVLLLHGEPSWSFLYRHMVPVLTGAGHRCVVPDLVGFGRSDKPAEVADYTYARQVAWTAELVFSCLDLTGITLVCQDWGGLVGLRLLAEAPERFARVVVANTGLPTGDQSLGAAFLAWQTFARETPSLDIGWIVNSGCTTDLAPEVVAGYDAPFPDDSYKAGARAMPSLVPTSPDDPAHADNVAAWEVLRRFERPFLCAFSDSDPITSGGDAVFRDRVPGAAGVAHITVAGGGHFLQEDRGPELGRVVTDFIAGTS